jgi:flagellar basal-body rod protein FlgB
LLPPGNGNSYIALPQVSEKHVIKFSGTVIALLLAEQSMRMQKIMLINFDQALGNHATAMKMRARRAEVLASNIANADTPGYKARDLDFRAALKTESMKFSMSRTHAGHMSATGGLGGGTELVYRIPNQAKLDGNTVSIQQEQAAFAENSLRYQASLRFLKGKFSSMISALRED